MKQIVVGLLVVAGVFTFGPWFAGKVGPPLAEAITEWATPEEPCPMASAEPTKRPHKARPHKARTHKARAHRKPHATAHPKQRHPKPAKPTSTCTPTPTPSGRSAG